MTFRFKVRTNERKQNACNKVVEACLVKRTARRMLDSGSGVLTDGNIAREERDFVTIVMIITPAGYAVLL